jgi:hypothetical protein
MRSSSRRDSCCDFRGPRHLGGLGPELQDGSGVAYRVQRVAQLVRQHRQELVLPPVGLAQRLLGEVELGDVFLDGVDVE